MAPTRRRCCGWQRRWKPPQSIPLPRPSSGEHRRTASLSSAPTDSRPSPVPVLEPVLNEKDVYVGSVSLFADLGVDLGENQGLVEELREAEKTVILVGDVDQVMGLIALRDQYRPEAPGVIGALHDSGIRNIVMLTGDNQPTAAAIAHHLGIDDVRADLKPADKSYAVDRLQKALGPVAMVGGGINDAPALATATVGIAMGTAGTDAAIEAADVALMGDDLRTIPCAISLGQRTRQISRQNVVFSIIILAVLVPAAVVGALSIAMAVLVHEVSEIIAVLNGLRARHPAQTAHPSTGHTSQADM
ncbi:MAG: HAD-IC family P-type ATPase [Acidimicrobiia bacterium]